MKKLILVIGFLFLLVGQAWGADYYVSNDGNDTAAGTSTSVPWQTIAKVNSVTFSSGDTVNFNRGGEWHETLNPVDTNITFQPYGAGSRPLINGAALLENLVLTPAAGADFEDDFESGISTSWVVGGTATQIDWGGANPAGPTGGGTYGLKIPSGSSDNYLEYTLNEPTNSVWVEFDVRTLETPSSSAIRLHCIRINDEDDIYVARVRLQGDGVTSELAVGSIPQNTVVAESAGTGSATWIKVKFQISGNIFSDPISTDVADVSGMFRAWKDAVKVIDIDGFGVGTALQYGYISSGLVNQKKFKSIRINGGAGSEDMYIDNFRVCSAELDGETAIYHQTVPNAFRTTDADILFVDGVKNVQLKASVAAISSDGDWYYNSDDHQLHIKLTNPASVVELPYRRGILFSGTHDDDTIDDTELKYCVTGISAKTASNATDSLSGMVIKNCYIHDNLYSGIGMTYYVRSLSIIDTIIERCQHGGIVSNLRTSTGFAPQFSVSRSRIDTVGLEGIAFEKSDGSTIAHSIIKNVYVSPVDTLRGTGIDLQDNDNNGNFIFYHNTISNCEKYGIFFGASAGSEPVITIKNNIISGESGSDYAINGADGGLITPTIDYNSLYKAGVSIMASYNGSDKTFAQWQASGFDANGISSDPLLSSTGKISKLSPAVDTGVWIDGENNIGQYDLWGEPVTRLINIGADQEPPAKKGGNRIPRIGGGMGF